MPGPHSVTQASPRVFSSAPQPPQALALTSLHRTASAPAQRQSPSQPQAEPGALSSVAQPPQLFGRSAPVQSTASAPSQTKLPPPQLPHSVPGSAASDRRPPQLFRGMPLQSHERASAPSQTDAPERSVPSQAQARPGCVGSTAQPPQALVRDAPRQAASPLTHCTTPPHPQAAPTATSAQGSTTVVSATVSKPPVVSESSVSSDASPAASLPMSVASAAASTPVSEAGFFLLLPLQAATKSRSRTANRRTRRAGQRSPPR